MAMVNCNIPLMDYFLTASGVSVDAREPVSGWTALHFVYTYEKISDADCFMCARFLVEEKGADPTLRCRKGNTPAVFARRREKMQTYRYVMQRGSRGGDSSWRIKKGRKVDNAQQIKASLEAAAEAARQAAARARLAEESLLAELEAEEEAVTQAKIEKKKGKEGKKSKKGEKKATDGAGARELTAAMGSLGLAWRGEGV